jgi:hypothetical protein
VCRQKNLLTRKGGGLGGISKLYDGEEAWSSTVQIIQYSQVMRNGATPYNNTLPVRSHTDVTKKFKNKHTQKGFKISKFITSEKEANYRGRRKIIQLPLPDDSKVLFLLIDILWKPLSTCKH